MLNVNKQLLSVLMKVLKDKSTSGAFNLYILPQVEKR